MTFDVSDLDDADETYEVPWAESIVSTSAYLHIAKSPACVGFTITNAGRARCGACDWRLSARLADVGTERSARFALFALAMIGATFTAELVQQIDDDLWLGITRPNP